MGSMSHCGKNTRLFRGDLSALSFLSAFCIDDSIALLARCVRSSVIARQAEPPLPVRTGELVNRYTCLLRGVNP